jgi:hypothetical protein
VGWATTRHCRPGPFCTHIQLQESGREKTTWLASCVLYKIKLHTVIFECVLLTSLKASLLQATTIGISFFAEIFGKA